MTKALEHSDEVDPGWLKRELAISHTSDTDFEIFQNMISQVKIKSLFTVLRLMTSNRITPVIINLPLLQFAI